MVKKTIYIKTRPAYNHLLRLEKSILGAQKSIGCQSKRTKNIKLIKNTQIEIKIRLSLTIPLLLIVNFRPRLSKKTSVMEIVEEAIQPLRLMPLR